MDILVAREAKSEMNLMFLKVILRESLGVGMGMSMMLES